VRTQFSSVWLMGGLSRFSLIVSFLYFAFVFAPSFSLGKQQDSKHEFKYVSILCCSYYKSTIPLVSKHVVKIYITYEHNFICLIGERELETSYLVRWPAVWNV